MTKADLLCLLPMIIVAVVPVAMMLIIALKRLYLLVYGISLAGFFLAFLSLFMVIPATPHAISPVFIFDGFSILFFAIILLAGIVTTLLSYRFLLNQESEKEEYFIMLGTSVLGAMVLAAASNFVTLFLGLETLSVSLYVLIAYRRLLDFPLEAGVKYLILASVSSAFLLFGMGLIYAGTGSMEFSVIGSVVGSSPHFSPLMLAATAMMMVGLGFKLALVPFHMWTPDVYQGAPVPVATFVATVSKGAVMALLVRFFYAIEGSRDPDIILMITALAVLSMFAGNLLAIRQQNVKRILAYSSIANMGYILVTLAVGKSSGVHAAIFYVISYMITTMGAFGVVTLLSDRDRDADRIDDYRGLFWKRPFIALAFTLALLSLAGIPLTAGFMAKFYLVFTGIDASLWVLVISLIVSSVIGLYYYLRIITTMFSGISENSFPPVSAGGYLVLGILSAGIVWLGLFPGWLLELISGFSGF
jgi:NADH-quinone oxidoreductase subunit N